MTEVGKLEEATYLDDGLYERLKARLPDSDRSHIVDPLSSRLATIKFGIK